VLLEVLGHAPKQLGEDDGVALERRLVADRDS
jgi:hypothetical protein